MEYVNHYTWIVVRALVIKDFRSFLLAYTLDISPHLASIRLLFIISWIWQRFLIRLILVSSFIFIRVSTIPIPFKFPLCKNSSVYLVLFYFILLITPVKPPPGFKLLLHLKSVTFLRPFTPIYTIRERKKLLLLDDKTGCKKVCRNKRMDFIWKTTYRRISLKFGLQKPISAWL